MSKIIVIKQDTPRYTGKNNEKTFLVSDKQANQLEELINKWRAT